MLIQGSGTILNSMKKIYFITPWFGSRSGGAEIYVEKISHFLAEKNLPITVLTTTSKSPFDDWDKDYYSAGEESVGKLKLIRFPVDPRCLPTYIEYYNLISKGTQISQEQEELYFSNTIRSSAMEKYISENKKDSLFFSIPYPYGVSYFGGVAALPNLIPIPCLHNEPTAWFKITKDLFEKSLGILFLTVPEKQLATTVYSLKGKPNTVIGGGIPNNINASPERFKKQFGIDEPFILYVGRKVPGKGIDVLLDFWTKLKEENKIKCKLVIIGGGELPNIINPSLYDIVDLGSAEETTKYDAIAACLALVHLSTKESLSIVLLEAWSLNKPVIVSELCPVTSYQVLNSLGGISIKDYYDFKISVNSLLTNPHLAKKMGENGKKYVEQYYTWEKVAESFIDFIYKLEN